MDVNETAACGIAQREFAIEFDDDELINFYRILTYIHEDNGFYEEDYLEDLKSQMSYIIGPSLEDPIEDDAVEVIRFKDEEGVYILSFNEDAARRLNQVLGAVEHPGEGYDITLVQKLVDQMKDMAPNILDNLPIINR